MSESRFAILSSRRAVLAIAAGMVVSAAGLANAERISPRVPRDHGPATKQIIAMSTAYRPGTILISNSERTLDLVLDGGHIARYTIAIGRPGFEWTGEVSVGGKVEWPSWRPPSEMRKRDPSLPGVVPPGPYNPLGARALYLFKNGRDTLYRIHGTNDRSTVGGFATSGCFRLTNADILELFQNIPLGTKVIVTD